MQKRACRLEQNVTKRDCRLILLDSNDGTAQEETAIHERKETSTFMKIHLIVGIVHCPIDVKQRYRGNPGIQGYLPSKLLLFINKRIMLNEMTFAIGIVVFPTILTRQLANFND